MRRVASIVTAPSTTAVSVAEVKRGGQISGSDLDDFLENDAIPAAIADVEQFLQRKLINQTWKMFLDYWPVQIEVLFGNLQSVTHVKYTDVDGTQETLPSTLYTVDTASVPGRIVLKHGQSWPSVTLSDVNPIEVQFVTGYGATGASIPADVKRAVIYTALHYNQNREPFVVSERILPGVVEIPKTASSLLRNHRVWRWCL